MKNMLLKTSIVLLFVVILFANFTCVQASIAEGVSIQEGEKYVKSDDQKKVMPYTVKFETAGNYSIILSGSDMWIYIVSNGGGEDKEFEGTAPLIVSVSEGITYTFHINEKSQLNISKGVPDEGDSEYANADLSALSDSNPVNLSDIPQAGTAEKIISIYFLDIGDYANSFLEKIFGEEVTIDKIVFNKVDMLNANFFNNTTNSASNNVTSIVRTSINKWFGYFKSLALVVIMISIVTAGIRILLQTPQAKVKGYESIKKVVLAVALIFFFPYVMRFAFEINETIIGYINQANTSGFIGAISISPYTNASEEDIEFRSPRYVSIEGKLANSNSSDNTEIYLSKVTQYEKSVDIMRLMRAFAGVTYRFVYVVLWYIMLAQVYILAFIYIKRYLTIAFLIIVYPLVIIGYVVDGIVGKRKGSFNTWSKKFFSSIFLQTLHAIMYGIISGVLVSQVLKTGDDTIGSQKINVILMIVATSFLFSGEKILTKFWKSSIDSSAERRGLRQAFGMPRRVIGSFKGK